MMNGCVFLTGVCTVSEKRLGSSGYPDAKGGWTEAGGSLLAICMSR